MLTLEQKQAALKANGYDPSQYTVDDDGNVYPQGSNISPAVGTNDVLTKPEAQSPFITPDSPLTTGVKSFAQAAPSSLAAGVGAAGGVAATPAIIGSLGLAPETGGLSLLGLLLPLLTGTAAAYGTSKLQQAIEPEAMQQNVAQSQAQNPIASTIGNLATLPLGGFNPSPTSAVKGVGTLAKLLTGMAPAEGEMANLANVGLGAGVGVAGGVAQDALAGKNPLDIKSIIENAAIGGLFNKPNAIGNALGIGHPEQPTISDQIKAAALSGKPLDSTTELPEQPDVQTKPPLSPLDVLRGVSSADVGMSLPKWDKAGNQLPQKELVTPRKNAQASASDIDMLTRDNAPVEDRTSALEDYKKQQDYERMLTEQAQDALRQKQAAQAELARQESASKQSDLAASAMDIQNSLRGGITRPEVQPAPLATTPLGREIPKDFTGVTEQANKEVSEESPEDLAARQAEGLSDRYQAPIQRTDFEKQMMDKAKTAGLPAKPTNNLFNLLNSWFQQKRGVGLRLSDKVSGMGETAVPTDAKSSVLGYLSHINPKKAGIDTLFHEPFHVFYNRLKYSDRPSDQRLVGKFEKLVSNLPEYKEKFGNDPHGVEEYITSNQGWEAVRRYMMNDEGGLKSYFKDMLSYIKTRYSPDNANEGDFRRILDYKFANDPVWTKQHGSQLSGGKTDLRQQNDRFDNSELKTALKDPSTGKIIVGNKGEDHYTIYHQLSEEGKKQFGLINKPTAQTREINYDNRGWMTDNGNFVSLRNVKNQGGDTQKAVEVADKSLNRLDKDGYYATIQHDNEVPGSGYVQMDEVRNGKNIRSTNPETLQKEGVDVPSRDELMKLPQGKHYVDESIRQQDDRQTPPDDDSVKQAITNLVHGTDTAKISEPDANELYRALREQVDWRRAPEVKKLLEQPNFDVLDPDSWQAIKKVYDFMMGKKMTMKPEVKPAEPPAKVEEPIAKQPKQESLNAIRNRLRANPDDLPSFEKTSALIGHTSEKTPAQRERELFDAKQRWKAVEDTENPKASMDLLADRWRKNPDVNRRQEIAAMMDYLSSKYQVEKPELEGLRRQDDREDLTVEQISKLGPRSNSEQNPYKPWSEQWLTFEHRPPVWSENFGDSVAGKIKDRPFVISKGNKGIFTRDANGNWHQKTWFARNEDGTPATLKDNVTNGKSSPLSKEQSAPEFGLVNHLNSLVEGISDGETKQIDNIRKQDERQPELFKPEVTDKMSAFQKMHKAVDNPDEAERSAFNAANAEGSTRGQRSREVTPDEVSLGAKGINKASKEEAKNEKDIGWTTFKPTMTQNEVVLKKGGVEGKRFVDAINKFYPERDQMYAKYYNDIHDSLSKLSRPEADNVERTLIAENRSKKDYSDYLKTPTEQNAYKTIRDSLRSMQEDRIEAKQPVTRFTNDGRPYQDKARIDPYYYPNQIAPKVVDALTKSPNSAVAEKLRQDFLNHQTDEGKTPAQAQSVLNSILKAYDGNVSDQSHFRGLDVQQGVGLPDSWMRSGLQRNLSKYVRKFTTARAFHDNIEANPDVAKSLGYTQDSWNKPIQSDSKLLAVDEAHNIVSKIRGDDYSPAESKLKSINRIATSLMLGPLTNIHIAASSLFNGLSYFHPTDTIKALTHVATNWGDGIQHAVENGYLHKNTNSLRNIVDAHTSSQEKLNSVANAIQTLTGRNATDYVTKGILQNMGEYLTKVSAVRAANGDKSAIRLMEHIDPDYQQGKQYSPDEINKLASNFGGILHGYHDSRTLPPWMLKDTIVQPFLSLASWNIAQTNNFMRHVWTPMVRDGNFTPMITATLGSLLGGYVIKEAREDVSNRKSPFPSLQELVASSRGVEGNIPLAAYNLMAMASYSGYAGLLGVGAKSVADMAFKNTPQAATFPLDEALSGSVTSVSQAISAFMNSQHDDYAKIGTNLITDLLKNNVQLARLGINYATDAGALGEQKQVQAKLGRESQDVRRFKMAEGMPYESQAAPSGDNPYLDLPEKEFRYTQDIPHAASELPDLLREALTKSNGNIGVLRGELNKLKSSGGYDTMFDPEEMPQSFLHYLNYLRTTQGDDKAQERLVDYFKQRAVKETKDSLVPTI